MSFRRWCVLSTVLFLSACQVSELRACYAVIVGREASADGSVLVGHNEENGGRRILNFRRIPRQVFGEGAVVRLRRGGELAQVSETAALLWSENPAMEFSDAYLNEWGVAVVSDACPTREDEYDVLVARGEIRDGGIGYMLRRLVAQRAKTARQGVQLAGALVERFGYIHSGRTYVIADPQEAWLMAVVRGRRWVAQRVPDDAVVVLPNIHLISEVDLEDTDRFLASADLIDYAVSRGWFDPRRGKPFNFRKAYRRDRSDRADLRRWRGRQLATGRREPWPPPEPPPIGVKPAQKMTVAAVAAILRDTAGPGRTLSASVGQEGAVLQLRAELPKEIGCVYWRTTAEPATSVLTPWYLGITATPASYFRAADVKTALSLEHHFSPPPGTFDVDADLTWWTFKALQDEVHRDFARRVKVVQRTWTAFEQRMFADQPQVERKAVELWQTDQDAARAYLTRHCAELAAEARQQAVELASSFRGRLQGSLDSDPRSLREYGITDTGWPSHAPTVLGATPATCGTRWRWTSFAVALWTSIQIQRVPRSSSPMNKYFAIYCVTTTGILLLAVYSGCGTAEYESRLEAGLEGLKQEGEANADVYPEKQIPDTPAWIRLPRSLAEAPLAGGAEVERREPMVVDLDGLKSTYEGTITDGGGGKMPFYCYLAAEVTAAERATKLGEAIRRQLQTELGGSIGQWQPVQCQTPDGRSSEWQKLRATGNQPFFYVDANGQGAVREMDGVVEFYSREDAGFIILIGWRMPTAIEPHVGLSEWAPRVAASIKWRAQ